jgi:hypothetical protein
MNKSTNLRSFALLRARRKKAKKRRDERDENLRLVNAAKWRKMKQKNTKPKQQQGSDVAKLIDPIEKAAETALKIYRIVKAVLKNGGKPNDKRQMAEMIMLVEQRINEAPVELRPGLCAGSRRI